MIWIFLFISTGTNSAAIKANFSDIPLQGFSEHVLPLLYGSKNLNID